MVSLAANDVWKQKYYNYIVRRHLLASCSTPLALQSTTILLLLTWLAKSVYMWPTIGMCTKA